MSDMDATARVDDALLGAAPARLAHPGFEPDLSAEDWAAKFRLDDLLHVPFHFPPFEVISAANPVGRGRTNLTLVRPLVVQTDAAEPHAAFDRRESPDRNPAVSVHFAPAAYGVTAAGTYVFTFAVDAPQRCAFRPSGFAGSGTVDAPGLIRFSGRRTITVILRNVPAGQEVFAAIEQTDGASWSWFTTSIGRPPIVIGSVLQP
ncbi:hypothetical protein ABIQ69_07645 [Agromyces sp. G08B096]|uniref:Uncharacterized protein n=1 Tax=Agromyces sp. G08B096 TaxID=3156399 RepID=A0AAU7WAV8_9MICO